ncbi:MAG TPA: hypothetical protein VFD06_05720 [Candidatus Polarisedimenticolia bacterium]|nr:hypothetical protein [Candidatus Polarisedimenticolia bacterium]
MNARFVPRVLLLAAALAVVAVPSAHGVARDVVNEARSAYEGRTLRLRLDLRSSASAIEPNTLTLEGIGYGRPDAPVLFGRLETVHLDRVASEGGDRLSLTVYRSREEMQQLRATAIPPPTIGGTPIGMQPMSGFARIGSTMVIFDLLAKKKDIAGQRAEIDTLMRRLFYIDDAPERGELEEFVRQHHSWPVPRLASVTGLSQDEVRAILEAKP